MKTLLLTSFLVLMTAIMGHAFPGSTNTATVAFSNAPALNQTDWKWRIFSAEDQNFTVTISDVGTASSYYWQFRMVSITGTVMTIDNSDITPSGSTVSWSIYPTNMPPAGTYKSELKAYVTDTNGVRAVAGQGLITIIKSLLP